jgi:hypothetical protein
MRQWLPTGDQFKVLVGVQAPGDQYLSGIATKDLIAAAHSILKSK